MRAPLFGVALAALASAGGEAMATEEPQYRVIENFGAVEIRDYAPMIVAEVTVAGDRNRAINQGFGMLADYIFGNNVAREKVAMTTPVTQSQAPRYEKIAMTTPVAQSEGEGGDWTVRFMMPSAYTLETLPQPRNAAVRLLPVPARRAAVLRFSGSRSETLLEKKEAELRAFANERGLATRGAPSFAFYDPPWTPSFFRRNEVALEIDPAAEVK
jgi:hypothetical protein